MFHLGAVIHTSVVSRIPRRGCLGLVGSWLGLAAAGWTRLGSADLAGVPGRSLAKPRPDPAAPSQPPISAHFPKLKIINIADSLSEMDDFLCFLQH